MRLNKGMLLGFCLLLLVDYSLALFNQTGKINGGGPANGHTRIRCLEDTIGIELDNIDGWDGRLYARKMGDDPNCVKHYSDHEKKIVFDIPFNFLPCGIKSKRMIHPRSGLEYTLTVILSKDHKHMTEDDQMFTLSCRYYSNYKDVGTVMEVSTFARNYLIGGQSGPSCEYSLRYGSLNGPPAQNARIGDKVYHEWKCADSSFAFKVYDCFVHDGAEKKYKLIDEEGCSKDKTIIPDLTYDPSLNFAFAASRVFKFAESTKMFFNCLLYMCPKSDPACRQVVPPRCSGRSKRFVNPDVQTLFTVNSTVSIPQNEEKSSEEMELSANQVMDNIIPNVGWSHRLYHPSLQTNIVIVTTTPIPELPNMLSDDTGSPTMSNDNINEETTLRNDDFNVMNDGDAQLHGVVVPPSHQIERDELDNLIKQHHQLFHHDDHLQDQGRHDGQDVHHEETNDLPESLQEISHQEYITPEAMTQMIPTLSESTSAPQSCSHLKEQFKKVLIALVFGNIVSLTVSVLLLARFCAKRHSDSMSVQFRGYGV